MAKCVTKITIFMLSTNHFITDDDEYIGGGGAGRCGCQCPPNAQSYYARIKYATLGST